MYTKNYNLLSGQIEYTTLYSILNGMRQQTEPFLALPLQNGRIKYIQLHEGAVTVKAHFFVGSKFRF